MLEPRRMFGIRALGTLLLLCALSTFAAPPAGTGAAAAQPAGWFGMRLNFDTDGRADPTVKSITVDDVFPDSPAARAQIAKGDEIVSVDGHAVAAAKARQIQGLLHKAVGESIQLELKRRGGEAYKVAMTAIHLPDSGPSGPAQ